MSPSILDSAEGATEGSNGTAAGGRKTGAIDGVAAPVQVSRVKKSARSNVRRAAPVGATTPPPPIEPLERRKAFDLGEIDHLRSTLGSFEVPEEGSLPKTEDEISPHQQPEVEQLFELIARVGAPLLPWETIRPIFLWKLRHVMEEMVRIEKLKAEKNGSSERPSSKQGTNPQQCRPAAAGWEEETSELRESYRFILAKAASFTAPPFTIQRLCELLVSPLRHYKTAEKFFRALEKTINVVTCVTEKGARITGVEDEEDVPMDCENFGRIECRFIGKVDEVDDVEMEQEKGEKEQDETMENGESPEKTDPSTEEKTSSNCEAAVDVLDPPTCKIAKLERSPPSLPASSLAPGDDEKPIDMSKHSPKRESE